MMYIFICISYREARSFSVALYVALAVPSLVIDIFALKENDTMRMFRESVQGFV